MILDCNSFFLGGRVHWSRYLKIIHSYENLIKPVEVLETMITLLQTNSVFCSFAMSYYLKYQLLFLFIRGQEKRLCACP